MTGGQAASIRSRCSFAGPFAYRLVGAPGLCDGRMVWVEGGRAVVTGDVDAPSGTPTAAVIGGGDDGVMDALGYLAAFAFHAPFAFAAFGSDWSWQWAGEEPTGGDWSTEPLLTYLRLPGVPLVVTDAHALADLGEGLGLGAWAAALVRSVTGSVMGVIGVGSAAPRDWSARELEMITRVAAVCAGRWELLAVANENAAGARRSRFLADVSSLLSSLPDAAGLSARLTRFCVPTVAAVAVMHRFDGDLVTVAVAHRDPLEQARWEETGVSKPAPIVSELVAAQVRTTGEPSLERLDRADPLAGGLMAADDDRGPWRIVVPIRSGPAVRGLLTWIGEPGVEYRPEDVALAVDFGHRAALAWEWADVFAERGRVAVSLQQSLLPAKLPHIPGLEVATRYVAADSALEVGGDFYDLFAARDGQWLAVIGDVVGRGVEAAGLTGLARHTLRAIGPQMSVDESLKHLNHLVHDSSDTTRMLTVAVARLSLDTQTATIARGGHCSPIIVKASGAVDMIEPRGWLIGAFDEIAVERVDVEFTAGDTLVLYTDGVTEARRDGEFFGEDRLLRLLAGSEGASAEETADRILAAVAEFSGATTRDDIALLILRRPPAAAMPIGADRDRSPLGVPAPRAHAAGPGASAGRSVPIFSAASVSRITGLAADRIAAWEERYGLVVAARTKNAARIFTGQQLDALRLVAAEMRLGSDEAQAHATLSRQLVAGRDFADFRSESVPEAVWVLVVDVNPYTRSVLERTLTDAGFVVSAVGNGLDARRVIADADIGIAVAEIMLPGESPIDLYRDLTSAAVPVLSYSSLRAVDQAFAAGADAFLTKPLQPARLVSTIRDILSSAPASTVETAPRSPDDRQ